MDNRHRYAHTVSGQAAVADAFVSRATPTFSFQLSSLAAGKNALHKHLI